MRLGVTPDQARGRAATLLARLNIPERLRGLSPTTFSGGEQQRVNIARGFVHPYPALLLDKPTARLDALNREMALASALPGIRSARRVGGQPPVIHAG